MSGTSENRGEGRSIIDRLLDVAANRGFSKDSVRDMHRLLHISEGLFGYVRRLRTLIDISTLTVEGKTLAHQCPNLPDWACFADVVLQHPLSLPRG